VARSGVHYDIWNRISSGTLLNVRSRFSLQLTTKSGRALDSLGCRLGALRLQLPNRK
jgi:hypothetical protein